jgi:hypothetical protein
VKFRFSSDAIRVDTSQGTPQGPRPDRDRLAAGAALAFVTLLLFSEMVSRILVHSGFWYDRFDFSGVLSSLPELQDRIRWASQKPQLTVLLGDSVLGAGALLERGVPDARRRTVPAFLRQAARESGWNVISLGADGLLLRDLEGIVKQVRRDPPRRTIVFLNVRMFAAEYQEGAGTASRGFLAAAAAAAWKGAPDQPPGTGLGQSAFSYCYLFRMTQLLKTLWYFPSQHAFFQRTVARFLGEQEDRDLQDATLALKVAPYYRSLWQTSAPSFRALDEIIDSGLPKGGLTLLLSPQNPSFLGGSVDPVTLERNRATLNSFLRDRKNDSFTYLDWSDRYPPEQFLDHCHLTPSGNRQLAQDLFRALRAIGS